MEGRLIHQPNARNRNPTFERTRGDLAVAPPSPRPSTTAAERQGAVLNVRTRSRPSAVVGAIAGVIRHVGRAEVQAIGAGATNQAVKAIAIARSSLQEDGIDLSFQPAFIDVVIDGGARTALRFVLEARPTEAAVPAVGVAPGREYRVWYCELRGNAR